VTKPSWWPRKPVGTRTLRFGLVIHLVSSKTAFAFPLRTARSRAAWSFRPDRRRQVRSPRWPGRRCRSCPCIFSRPSNSRRLRACAETKSSGATLLCSRLNSMVYDFGRGHGYNNQRDTASPRLGAGAFANGGRGGDPCR